MTREFRLNRIMQRYALAGTVGVIGLLALTFFVSVELFIVPALLGTACLMLFFIEDALFALTATPDRSLLVILVVALLGLILLSGFLSLLQVPVLVIVAITLLVGLRMKIASRLVEVSLTHLRLPSEYREWRWEEFTDIRRTDKRLALYVEDELAFNLPRVEEREALYDIIVDQVALPLMHRKLAKMRGGGVVNFPNVKLTNELVVIEKDAIPVHDIENAVLDRWRHLSIYSDKNGVRHIDVQHYVLAEELIKEQQPHDLGNRRDVHTERSRLTHLLCRSGVLWRPPIKHIEVYDDGVIVSSRKHVKHWRWEDFSEIQTSNNRTRLMLNGDVVADIPGLLKTD